MARALTADEKLRYPWASRVTDFVPAGRWRSSALLCAGLGVVAFGLGAGFLYVTAADVRAGVSLTSGTIGRLTLVIGGSLLIYAFVTGLITGVTALIKNAMTPLMYSLGAMAPVLIFALIVVIIGR
jgi:hypothetical protein